MKWEWGFGEVILIVLALYELWSLRKYKAEDTKADRTARPKDRDR
jgi:hypothetical protein